MQKYRRCERLCMNEGERVIEGVQHARGRGCSDFKNSSRSAAVKTAEVEATTQQPARYKTTITIATLGLWWHVGGPKSSVPAMRSRHDQGQEKRRPII